MERYRIELGSEHGIKPGNIVGAIANEADINSRYIGRIAIFDTYSTVDLPFGMPDDTLRLLHKSRVGNKTLKLQRMVEQGDTAGHSSRESKKGTKPTKRGGKPTEPPISKGRKKAAHNGPAV